MQRASKFFGGTAFLAFWWAAMGCSAEAPAVAPPAAPVQTASPVACSEERDPGVADNGCLRCHRGIEMIRCGDTPMMKAILERAEECCEGNRCVVCHGGDPSVRPSELVDPGSEQYAALEAGAHAAPKAGHPDAPEGFFPDPGSPWINAQTCGRCHGWYVQAQWRSLMMTEAGKIQGTAWGFGGLTGYEHIWANYDVDNPEPLANHAEIVGTEAFRAYLLALAASEPNVFVPKMIELPKAPAGGDDVRENPSLAAATYLRGECQRCHLGVGGKERHGDFRGMGCSACHMPYSNAGVYEGGDRAILAAQDAGARPGRPLVHTIQATEEAVVTAGDVSWTGIPVETCTTCHNRGRRIGVSYQGLMETPYESPWTDAGDPQPKLHGKRYLKMRADVHAEKGFLCQDCHTSVDAHSPNYLIGAIGGAVEIECTDCHGTPRALPWELPLGLGDEFSEDGPKRGPPRGVAHELPDFVSQGHSPPAQDGYLLSARGNPLGNAVRTGDEVDVHLASGATIRMKPLKLLAEGGELSPEGTVAMVRVGAHLDRMECYTCHATWAPQCYGCHIKVDYTEREGEYDWVELGKRHRPDGLTSEYEPEAEAHRIPGKIVETRSYLRWENPPLAQNGEGRIAPAVPGCQTTVTVVDDTGKAVIANHAFRIPNVEGAGEQGQLGLDIAPLQPHTTAKRARTCESCHADPKALGYGIEGGRLFGDPSKQAYVDLMTGEGKVIPDGAKPQFAAITALGQDWSRFVSEAGEQLQTVGHHFRLSRPLNDRERAAVDREGICVACHQEIPDESLAVGLLHHVAAHADALPKTAAEHAELVHGVTMLAAWGQVGAVFAGIFLAVLLLVWRVRRRRDSALLASRDPSA